MIDCSGLCGSVVVRLSAVSYFLEVETNAGHCATFKPKNRTTFAVGLENIVVCLLSEAALCGVRYKKSKSNVKPTENRASLTPDKSGCLTRRQCCANGTQWYVAGKR